MKGNKILLLLLTLVLILSQNSLSFAENLEPIEDPKIYKKFDILENLTKKKFSKRLEEQEKILNELENQVDIIQYNMFRQQYDKNLDFFEENYKSIFTKIKEYFAALLERFVVIIGSILLFPLFCLLLSGSGNLSDEDIMYMHLEQENEERRIKEETERRNRR